MKQWPRAEPRHPGQSTTARMLAPNPARSRPRGFILLTWTIGLITLSLLLLTGLEQRRLQGLQTQQQQRVYLQAQLAACRQPLAVPECGTTPALFTAADPRSWYGIAADCTPKAHARRRCHALSLRKATGCSYSRSSPRADPAANREPPLGGGGMVGQLPGKRGRLMPVNQASLIDQQGMILLELPMMLLITSLGVQALWGYQQQLQQQFLQLEWQQQVYRLAYYSLEAARTQQGQPSHFPPLPSRGWQRRWQISPVLASCRRLTVTVTAPGAVQAQLSALWCPIPLQGGLGGQLITDPKKLNTYH